MSRTPTLYIVDDDESFRQSLAFFFRTVTDLAVETYASAEAFLSTWKPGRGGCLLLDLRMPGLTGLQLQAELAERQAHMPIIFISGHGDIAASVRAVKAGAVDFIEKPCDPNIVLQRVYQAMEQDAVAMNAAARAVHLKEQYGRLSRREKEVLGLVVAGKRNKEIARRLNISHRTVEIHRSNLLKKMEVDSLAALITKAVACGCEPAE